MKAEDYYLPEEPDERQLEERLRWEQEQMEKDPNYLKWLEEYNADSTRKQG